MRNLKRYECPLCHVTFGLKELFNLHIEIGHEYHEDSNDENRPLILPSSDVVAPPIEPSYYDLLEKKAKKFPYYSRYLGHGTDYYNEIGLHKSINELRRGKPNMWKLQSGKKSNI